MRIGDSGQSSLVIVYGRRRVGKTSLIERAFGRRGLLKIEGLEQGGVSVQLRSAVQQIAAQVPDRAVTAWNPRNWGDLFRLVGTIVQEGRWTLYFEEYQWLSSYRSQLTAELKLAWDNFLSHNPKLVVVLCGSSPSFMVNKVLRSQSLYNRSQHEFHVRPLPFVDAKKLLPKGASLREAFDAYLLVGGIPEYLLRLSSHSSCYLSFGHEAFSPDGFFVHEYDRMIVSSLANNPGFGRILKHLAKRSFCDRADLARALNMSPGGELSRLLEELELCGLIRSYIPVDKSERSLLLRYSLADPFLRTYFTHMLPRMPKIQQRVFSKAPAKALSYEELTAHLGYAFEQRCVTRSSAISEKLGFSSVNYRSGSYFSRVAAREIKGYQLDLLFERADKVTTICEIKYTNEPVDSRSIAPFERTVSLFGEMKNTRIHRVLISASGATPALERRGYFDSMLTLRDLWREL